MLRGNSTRHSRTLVWNDLLLPNYRISLYHVALTERAGFGMLPEAAVKSSAVQVPAFPCLIFLFFRKVLWGWFFVSACGVCFFLAYQTSISHDCFFKINAVTLLFLIGPL